MGGSRLSWDKIGCLHLEAFGAAQRLNLHFLNSLVALPSYPVLSFGCFRAGDVALANPFLSREGTREVFCRCHRQKLQKTKGSWRKNGLVRDICMHIWNMWICVKYINTNCGSAAVLPGLYFHPVVWLEAVEGSKSSQPSGWSSWKARGCGQFPELFWAWAFSGRSSLCCCQHTMMAWAVLEQEVPVLRAGPECPVSFPAARWEGGKHRAHPGCAQSRAGISLIQRGDLSKAQEGLKVLQCSVILALLWPNLPAVVPAPAPCGLMAGGDGSSCS